MNDQTLDVEYLILENIYDSIQEKIPLHQRELAHAAGTSLGMTNSIVKRLAQKGWISIKKLNSRNIYYAVTLEGLNEITRRGYNYFKRTIKNVAFYKESLDELVRWAKRNDVVTVLLVGVSDLDFIVDHLCHRYGLSFFQVVELKTALHALNEHVLAIFSENIPDPAGLGETGPQKNHENRFYLSRMVMKKAVGEIR